jgi:hypothetical protein
MTTGDLESRVSALEIELARLRGSMQTSPDERAHPVQTLDKIHGVFENDFAFREAMRLGRKWRESQRPKARKRKNKHR